MQEKLFIKPRIYVIGDELMMEVYVVASIFVMFVFLLVFSELETMTDDELGGCSKRTTVQKRVISSRKIANLISTCCNGPTQLDLLHQDNSNTIIWRPILVARLPYWIKLSRVKIGENFRFQELLCQLLFTHQPLFFRDLEIGWWSEIWWTAFKSSGAWGVNISFHDWQITLKIDFHQLVDLKNWY